MIAIRMRTTLALAAFLALAACSEDPIGPGGLMEVDVPSAVHGTFAAGVAPTGTLGTFSVAAKGENPGGDLLGRGAVVYLDFYAGGAIRGRLLVPENGFGVATRSAKVTGRWSVDGSEIRLETADAWLSRARFVVEGSALSATFSVDGRSVTLALDPVAPTPSVSPEAVAAARNLWNARGPEDYTMLLHRSCFCGNTGDFVVEVENGVTVAARRADTGEVVEMLENMPSVDALFDLLEAELARPADRVLAEFDEDLGFPTSIDVDPDFQVADDEVSYRILELPTDR